MILKSALDCNMCDHPHPPAVVLVLDVVHPDNGVLHPSLVVVGVGLGPHAEGVGLEAGLAEHRIEPAQQTRSIRTSQRLLPTFL